MNRRVFTCLVLVALAAGVVLAKGDIKGAGTPKSWLTMGHLNFYSITSEHEGEDAGESSFDVCLGPRVLYFPIPGLGVGADLGYDASFGDGYTQSTLAVGPRAAYYLLKTEERTTRSGDTLDMVPCGWLMPYAGVTVQYVAKSTKYGEGDPQTSNGWRARVGVGISPLLGKRATLPVELGYQMENVTAGDEGYTYTTKENRIYLEVGFGAFLWHKTKK